MKRNQFFLGSLASLAAFAMAPFAKADTTPIGDVLPVQQGAAPGVLPVENIDGSKVDRKVQNAAAKVIETYLAAKESGNQQAMDGAVTEMEALHGQDAKNLSVLTWLGYMYNTTGQHDKAVAVLETVRGKSSAPAVNIANLRNLSASYYLSRKYAPAIGALRDLDAMEPDRADTLSLLGSAYVLSKDYASAISPLEKAKGLTAKDSDSYRAVCIDLGISYYRTSRADKAMSLFDEIRNDPRLSAEQLGWMGFIYLQNDRASDAVTTLEKANKVDANNPGVINNLASAYLKRGQRGDEERAAGLYERLFALVPDNGTAAYNAGSMYLAQGNFAKAKPILAKAAAVTNDPFAFNNLGRACEGLGQTSEAAANYSKASDMRSDVVVFARNAGFAMVRAGNDALAIKYLDRAYKLGDRDSKTVMNLASALSRTNQHEKAMAMLGTPEAQKTLANDADYWYNMGVVHAGMNRVDDAEAAYRKSLTIRPDDIDATNNLALLLWRKKDYAGALSMFSKLSGLSNNSTTARLNVAACHVKLGHMGDAMSIWRDIVRAEPKRTDVRLDLADALWNSGDSATARFHYSEALKQDAGSARALNGLGMWTLLQSDTKGAESYFRKAVQADRTLGVAYVNLAVVLERQNRVKEAVTVLESAVKADPDNADAKKALARLKSG